MPGLVNTHTHLRFSAFRGFAPSCGFGEWILRLLLAARKLDPDDYAASALWGAYECARSGVTTIADTVREGWIVARAAGVVGLRARVYVEFYGLDDAELPATMERLESDLERSQRESSAIAGRGPAVEWGISPHAPYTVSARLYREAARFSRRAGLRLATHVAESQAEVELLTRGTSVIAQAYKAANLWTGQHWAPPRLRPVQYVAQTGVLGPETLVIHAVQCNVDDIVTLADSRVAVAHCPRSNLRLQCGVAPVADMIAAGISVGLGTDSLASNDSLDMFAEMRAAVTASRARPAVGARAAAPGPGAAPALATATVLRMATLDGARALGWDHLVGSLEIGKRADIIVVRLSGATADPISTLIDQATADDIKMTMVDGVVTFDGEQEIPAEVEGGFEDARAKLGLGD
jgi:5-methylthioadenosine/S-adenosylhomocysteine deaminase